MLKTCDSCQHYKKGSCEAPLPAPLLQMNPEFTRAVYDTARADSCYFFLNNRPGVARPAQLIGDVVNAHKMIDWLRKSGVIVHPYATGMLGSARYSDDAAVPEIWINAKTPRDALLLLARCAGYWLGSILYPTVSAHRAMLVCGWRALQMVGAFQVSRREWLEANSPVVKLPQ